MRNAAPLLLLAALAASACGDGSAAPAAAVRDSAGITIVENAPVGAEAPLRLPAEPEVDIGLLEGEEAYQLDAVRGSARLGDGRIAILNGGSSEVRFFDAEGVFLHATGGSGEGPGEFRSPWLAGRLGDTLVVFDGANQRLTYIDPAGAVVAEHRVDVAIPFARPAGLLDDGRLALRAGITFRPDAPPGLARHDVPVVLLHADGAGADSLGAFPGPEMVYQGPRASRLPFARDTEVAADGDHVYVAPNEAWEVRVMRPDGSVERLIRVAGEPAPVTPEELDRYVEEQVAAAPAEHQAGQRRHYAEMPSPTHHPPHGRLLVDRHGRLWARDAERSGADPALWSVFDAEGRRLARVETPPRLRVHEIGADYVLGVWHDELDVARVRLYRLPALNGGR